MLPLVMPTATPSVGTLAGFQVLVEFQLLVATEFLWASAVPEKAAMQSSARPATTVERFLIEPFRES
ncbi:MAG: hypothetical protein ACOVJ6_02710 [Pirellulales bacterium]